MSYKLDTYLTSLNELMTEMSFLITENVELSRLYQDEFKEEYLMNIQKNEEEVNHLDNDIEALCFKIILRTQPVAKDLLFVEACLKVITDLERISDQTLDLTKLLSKCKNLKNSTLIDILKEMSKIMASILDVSLLCFINGHLEENFIYQKDKKVNDKLKEVKNYIIKEIKNDQFMDEYLDLLLAAKYVEKIADHAKNIFEWGKYRYLGVHRSEELL